MGYLAHGVLNATRRTKLIAAVLSFGALAGAGFLVARRGLIESKSDRQSAALAEKVDAGRARVLADAGRDSDGDGLKDWEEEIYRTKPDNPDTDGDGTPDGEEIRQDRDPLKKGPDDKPAEPSTATAFKNEDYEKNLTLNFTKSLLQSGVLDDVDENGNVASTDLLNRLNKLRLPKNINPDALLKPAATISANNLETDPKSDPATIKKYFNSLYGVYSRNIIPFQKRGDLKIVTEVLQSADYSRLSELDVLIRALDRSVNEIKAIPVPSGYQGFALRELVFLQKTRRAVEIFRNTDKDPLATAIIIKPRIDLFIDMAKLHAETKAKLDSSGIVFNANEGGYAYFQ